MEEKNLVKKRILILILVLAILLIGSILAVFFLQKDGASHGIKYAEIYIDNELYTRINLDEVEEACTIKVGDENDYNLVQIEPGRVGMAEASCPDKLCVQMGMIDNALMPVTCLPNHVVIRVVESDTSSYDGFTY